MPSRNLILSLLFALVASLGMAQQPIPDTFVSTGMVSNFGSPYNPAPYIAAGTLVTSPTSTMPLFVAMRYEFYRDAQGRPAYAALASAKLIFMQKGRFFAFADNAFGGAGTANNISSAFQTGGGVGIQLGRYSATRMPHWELAVEPQARRIPALAKGTEPALLVGLAYTFNRPK